MEAVDILNILREVKAEIKEAALTGEEPQEPGKAGSADKLHLNIPPDRLKIFMNLAAEHNYEVPDSPQRTFGRIFGQANPTDVAKAILRQRKKYRASERMLKPYPSYGGAPDTSMDKDLYRAVKHYGDALSTGQLMRILRRHDPLYGPSVHPRPFTLSRYFENLGGGYVEPDKVMNAKPGDYHPVPAIKAVFDRIAGIKDT